MSDYTEAKVTLTICGDERDCFVRAFVNIGWGFGGPNGPGAEIDGDPDVMLNGTWCPVDSVDLTPGDEESIVEALELAALQNDEDQCAEPRDVDFDDYEAA